MASNRKITVPLVLELDLLEKLDNLAKERAVSRSQLVREILRNREKLVDG